ncbi:hypothetical protein K470DRAFT_260414 [Piedraia hortae CBS 480.64]|uniref:Uncharacterized protein n=1 Tax=Piedraia hortae CBS 480.64 TaxID=1314780 RepID=A0A6A7BTJ1_9PEZI|nr:hypothetical protein K470DRAFT_260414 [Piedraia hortae CBS 480.64]
MGSTDDEGSRTVLRRSHRAVKPTQRALNADPPLRRRRKPRVNKYASEAAAISMSPEGFSEKYTSPLQSATLMESRDAQNERDAYKSTTPAKRSTHSVDEGRSQTTKSSSSYRSINLEPVAKRQKLQQTDDYASESDDGSPILHFLVKPTRTPTSPAQPAFAPPEPSPSPAERTQVTDGTMPSLPDLAVAHVKRAVFPTASPASALAEQVVYSTAGRVPAPAAVPTANPTPAPVGRAIFPAVGAASSPAEKWAVLADDTASAPVEQAILSTTNMAPLSPESTLPSDVMPFAGYNDQRADVAVVEKVLPPVCPFFMASQGRYMSTAWKHARKGELTEDMF